MLRLNPNAAEAATNKPCDRYKFTYWMNNMRMRRAEVSIKGSNL